MCNWFVFTTTNRSYDNIFFTSVRLQRALPDVMIIDLQKYLVDGVDH